MSWMKDCINRIQTLDAFFGIQMDMSLQKRIRKHRSLLQTQTEFCQTDLMQGTASAELQAVKSVDAHGSTAYVNLEPVDCGGGSLAVKALVEAGVQHVVIGMLHPLSHLRGQAIKATINFPFLIE